MYPGPLDTVTIRIPFNRVTLTGKELAYIEEAVRRGHLSGDGAFTKRCSELLQREVGVPRALLTTSCTHALEMAALLVGLRPGDEVIVPSFAFVTTVNAFVLHGAKPVFADVRPDTLNLDEKQLPALIGPRTRAVIALHYAGVACELDEIARVTRDAGAMLIEDNAHGLFGQYRGKQLGTFGALATQSFHETKNLTCGEGGALLINDPRFVERAEILREKGTNRSRFFRGQVDKYTWVDVGSSYLPSEILAAFLLAQLESRELVQAERGRRWSRYREELAAWAAHNGVGLPSVPAHCVQPFHMFYLMMPDLEARTRFIEHLKQREILAVFHYQALNLSDMGRRFGGRAGQCPVTEDVADRLVRLPLFHGLEDADQSEVIEAVLGYTI
jgi:dTDP-4-amino-4,6-dideoxygalactose transaminase